MEEENEELRQQIKYLVEEVGENYLMKYVDFRKKRLKMSTI